MKLKFPGQGLQLISPYPCLRTQTPSDQVTKISTPATTQPDTSWISATIDKSEFVVGGLATLSGTVSGTTGPVVYSVYTLEDVRDNNYNNPATTKSFYPSAGGTYKTTIYLDPKILPGRILRNCS